jgi:hypothetical protein
VWPAAVLDVRRLVRCFSVSPYSFSLLLPRHDYSYMN